MMIYPLYLVTVEQPEQRDVVERTLRAYANQRALPAMAGAHLVPALTAFGKGDEAHSWIQRALKDMTPNGLWDHGGNQGYQGRRVEPGSRPKGDLCIEASLCVANSLQTMLLQSWGDTIRVFPAMPTGVWPDAVFHNLLAEGAFLVSARRADGKTQWVRIKSLAGEPCRVLVDGELKELQLAKGEEVVLDFAGGDSRAVVEALPLLPQP